MALKVERIYRFRTARMKYTYAGALAISAEGNTTLETPYFRKDNDEIFQKYHKIPKATETETLYETTEGGTVTHVLYKPVATECKILYPKHMRKRLKALRGWKQAILDKNIITGTLDEVEGTRFKIVDDEVVVYTPAQVAEFSTTNPDASDSSDSTEPVAPETPE